MRSSDQTSLDQFSGIATSGQGEVQTAKSTECTTKASKRRTACASDVCGKEISEPPNKSSSLPLAMPTTVTVGWKPRDKMRLIIIVGLLLLLFVSMLTHGTLTDQLMTVLSLVTGYLFGNGAKPKVKNKLQS